ncbi:MAG: NUDIX domain-containing protein [Myxococcales bacterium]|nr:NUDIX domain-containing protein [Myxococcales bacterium]
MLYERSCGVIPFRRREGVIEFLLLHSAMVRNPDAAWEFPKGSLEEGESEQDAALRELREEAHISAVNLLPDFRDQVHYGYRRAGREIDKTVVFFLGEVEGDGVLPAEAPTREHRPHPSEGIWYVWATERDAMRRLFHPGMRKLLGRATFFLHEHDRIARRRRRRRETR